MKLRMLLTGVVLSLFAARAMAQVPGAWLGSWKLNVAKSNLSQVPWPAPKSQIDKNEAVEGALKYTSDRVSADGKAFRHEYTAKLDGKNYTYVGLQGGNGTISLTKVDDHTMKWTISRGGQVVMHGQTVYSPDGKLRTTNFTALVPEPGRQVLRHVEGTWVFDRE